MKKMQDEYWVAKAGPASDLTQMKVRAPRPRSQPRQSRFKGAEGKGLRAVPKEEAHQD